MLNKFVLVFLLILCSINVTILAEEEIFEDEAESEGVLMDPMLVKYYDDIEILKKGHNFFLGGIINDKDTNDCVIDGQVLSVGDRIADCFISRITDDSVILINDKIKATKLTIY